MQILHAQGVAITECKMRCELSANFPKIDPPVSDARLYRVKTQNGFPEFNSQQLTSSNIQLSSIPEKVVISARRTPSLLTPMDAESYLVIKNSRVNFNKSIGLLSTCTDKQLYDASLKRTKRPRVRTILRLHYRPSCVFG